MKFYKTNGTTVVLHEKGLRIEATHPRVAATLKKAIESDFRQPFFGNVVAKQGADLALLGPKVVGNERYRG